MIAAVPFRLNVSNRRLYLLIGLVFVGIASLIIWHFMAPDAHLQQPGELNASMEATDYVKLTWAVVDGASAYRVYRDGEPIATVEGDTEFYDWTAEPGGLPAAPVLTTSDDNLKGVMLRWNEPDVPAGTAHTYQVRAVDGGARSERSLPALGYRAADPVIEYEVRILRADWSSLDWTSVGLETSYFDDGTEEIKLRIAASEGEHEDYVELELKDSFPQSGSFSEYRVRAVNSAGHGASSHPSNASRTVHRADTFQWQRSAGFGNADFDDIPGANSAQFRDTDIAPGHLHYYRLVVGVSDMQPVATDATIGFRRSPNESFVGGPSQRPEQFCGTFVSSNRCWCRSDDEQDIQLCKYSKDEDGTVESHQQVYLIVSGSASQRALRIVDAAFFEDGDSHGGVGRNAPDFEVGNASAGLIHLKLTSCLEVHTTKTCTQRSSVSARFHEWSRGGSNP